MSKPINLEGEFAGKYFVEFGILHVEDNTGFVEPVRQSAFSEEGLHTFISQLSELGWDNEIHYSFADLI